MTGMDHRLAGQRIKAWRTARGLTQRELADLIGTTNQQIARLESGQRQITVDWLYRIANKFGVSITDVLEGSPHQAEASALDELFLGIERHWKALGTDYARNIFIKQVQKHFPELNGKG